MSPWLRSSSGAEAVETEGFPGDLHGVEVAQGQNTELQPCGWHYTECILCHASQVIVFVSLAS